MGGEHAWGLPAASESTLCLGRDVGGYSSGKVLLGNRGMENQVQNIV